MIRLDIGGSFLGTSADSLLFPDGEFSATDLNNPPLLTINAPVGLLFRDNPAPITSNAGSLNANGQLPVGLEVRSGQNISLFGGNVTLTNALVIAPGGRIEFGGLSAAGTINLDANLRAVFSDNVARADVNLSEGSIASVSGDGTGSIVVESRNIDLSDGSQFFGGVAREINAPEVQAGNITLNATNTITLDGINTAAGFPSGIQNTIESGATGNSGDIQISARNLALTNGAQILTLVRQGNAALQLAPGNGTGGDINIDVDELVSLDSNSLIASSLDVGAIGQSGNINLTTNSLSLTNRGQITSGTFGRGNGGSVDIEATDSIDLDGDLSGVFNSVESGAIGNAGGISITTNSLNITNGAQITAATFSEGNGGSIVIDIANSIALDGQGNLLTGIFNTVEPDATGNAGGITINTNSIDVNEAQLNVATFGEGDAGNLTINASDSINLSNNDVAILINATVQTTATGNGGNVEIDTNNLNLTGGAQISASTFGQGNAGVLNLTANNAIAIDGNGSAIGARVEPGATGNGGDVTINTGNLTLTDGAFLSTSTLSEGNSGTLNITANSLEVDASRIEAQVEFGLTADGTLVSATGQGGSVNIDTNTLNLTNGGQISVRTLGEGDAGNLTIDASQEISLSNGGGIFAQVFGEQALGNGGNVRIDTRTLNVTNDGDISVTTFAAGNAGNLNINVASLSVNEGGQIAASTFSDGDGGNLNITASNFVKLSGRTVIGRSGLFANAINGASGNGGDLSLTTDRLSISDGATINVSNFQSLGLNTPGTGEAGNLTINVRFRKLGYWCGDYYGNS